MVKNDSILELGFAELMNIKITSAAKKVQSVSGTPTAINVITADDIRRSGAVNLPEALRLDPGIHVARVDSHTWAITSRGFNTTTANQLLVLIDGRSVYTPLFSGTFWDAQDVVLTDVDRIEVIRGPGAVAWGANAVNGVINIITKSARDSQGGFVRVAAGNEMQGYGAARYGGPVGKNGAYRIYGKHVSHDDTELRNGQDADDRWQRTQGGFRTDWDFDSDRITLQGDLYSGEERQLSSIHSFSPPSVTDHGDDTDFSGANLLGRWTRRLAPKSQISFQSYYDHTDRNIPQVFDENRETVDVEVDHQFPIGERHGINWGLNYRRVQDQVADSFTISWNPSARTTHLYGAFLQDEIRFNPEWMLLIGSKVEDNFYSGVDIQPSARLAWTPVPKHTIWSGVSRAVRAPSRIDTDFRANIVTVGPPAAITRLEGTRDFKSEVLVAYEAGYRGKPTERTFLDFSAFYNVYDKLRSVEFGTPFTENDPAPAHQVVPVFIKNELEGESFGFEFGPHIQLTPRWQLQLDYAFLDMDLRKSASSTDRTSVNAEGNDPENQFAIRSFMDLAKNWQLDTTVRYVDDLPNQNVPSYTVADIRVGWTGIPDVDLELIGQNLLDSAHAEFGTANVKRIEPSLYGRATYKF